MSNINGGELTDQPLFRPVYPEEQLARRGVLVARQVHPDSVTNALSVLQDEFGSTSIEPLDEQEPLRLTVVGRFESARAIIQASAEEVVSTPSVHQALHENFPSNLRRGLTSFTQRFAVDTRPHPGENPVVSLRMTTEAFPVTRLAATTIIDEVTGRPYPWRRYIALVPIGHLAIHQLRQDVQGFQPKTPIEVRLSKVFFDYKRRKSR